VLSDRDKIYHQLLVLRCRRGDAAAWRELIAAWEPRLFYYVRRLVKTESDAWDVLQQTWLGAVQNLRTLGDPKLLAPWLYRIARNKAISLRRLHVPEQIADDHDVPSDDDTGTRTSLDNVDAVHAALDELPVHHREVLTLHFLQDLSVDQVAELLGIPTGTVKSRLFHAKRALKAVLERQEASP
jgi:RNA polymerase sigma-70 factor (ECF subfamily)